MRRNFILLAALLIVATAAHSEQPIFGPRDPNAARKDFSNVDPSTAIDALNLGTMATEAKTDYVATSTFTGHTDATGTSVHGLGTMSTATATDYAKLDTDASFTGRIDFNSSSPTNFTATFTINGEDVLGDISTALDGILGS